MVIRIGGYFAIMMGVYNSMDYASQHEILGGLSIQINLINIGGLFIHMLNSIISGDTLPS